MKISLNWIREFVKIPEKYSAKELAELLTLRTCEVEEFEDQRMGFSGVFVGEIMEIKPHPAADKLSIAKVNIGGETPLQIIFGQMVAMKPGYRVPVAVAPTRLPTGIVIEKKKLRGVESQGMLCLDQELGLKSGGVSIRFFDENVKPGTPLANILGLDDVIFEIDNKSLTHRPDLWSHYGIAREFAAILEQKLLPFSPKVKVPAKGAKMKVSLEKPGIAYRFFSCIITGLKIEPSPEWMQKRLQACGVRPVNNIVDITNFVMLETGHPMHAFDRKLVGTDVLEVRMAKKEEKIVTIDHKKRTLGDEDAVITNGKELLGIAGIMGGANSEINMQTAEIVLEMATWNPVMIRKTAQRQDLRTDAAQRFEKSLDPENSRSAFLRACELVLSVCPGAKLAGPITDVYPEKAKNIRVDLDMLAVNKKIGAEIPTEKMISYLKLLGFGVKKIKKSALQITVPSFRATKDINIEDDLLEEIARMYGYEKITPALPSLPIKLPHENKSRQLEHKIRKIFSYGLGFSETYSYSFYGESERDNFFLPDSLHLKLTNPLTSDQTHLRISMIPNLLKAVQLNLKYRKDFKLYELGNTYIKDARYFPKEEKFIGGVVLNPASNEVFYDALGAAQEFFKQMRIRARVENSAKSPPYSHPSKCCSLIAGGQEIAAVFELHPETLKKLDIKNPCAGFEINFTKLLNLAEKEFSFSPLPKFPGIEIDVSVLAPEKTAMRTVQELIMKAGQSLIADIALVDLFQNESLGAGKKSFTFRILLQSPDRTLTNEEMKEIQERIFAAVQNSGFSVRGL